MKKITLFLTLVFLIGAGQVQARNNGLNGLLIGAGSGAIIGQAIGHNTGGTLIGTAVGSMFGYMFGNEMDKSGGTYTRTVYRQRQIYRPVPARRIQPYRLTPAPRYDEPVCRETRTLATIDGEAVEIHGVACLEDGQWRQQQNRVDIAQTVIVREGRDDERGWRRMRHHDRWEHRRHHR